MVEVIGRKDLAFHHPKVRGEIGVSGFVDDDRMSDWVEAVFVCPRVEGCEIKVVDLLTLLDHVMQLNGIRASPEERVSWLEPGHEFERLDKLTHNVVLVLQSFPLTFPHDDHIVPLGEQGILFEDGGFVDIANGLVIHLVPGLVTVGKTVGAPVPKATVEFVHGVGVFIVPIHVIRSVAAKDHVLSSVGGMSNVHVAFSVEVHQPFQGREGMGLTLRVPSIDRFRGQGALGHVFGTVEQVASQGDGDASFEWVEPADLFKFLAEHLASAFEQEHVRFAVGHEFFLKVKDVIGIVPIIPLVEFLGSLLFGKGPTYF